MSNQESFKREGSNNFRYDNIQFYVKNKHRGDLKLKKNFYILYVKSSLRGFHINISNSSGKVLKVFSTGKLGYKKAQRYNPFSLLALVNEVLAFLKKTIKIKKNFKISIVLKGFSSKRNRFIKRFLKSFLKKSIVSIIDLTDLPYNGCRPKKLRRK